jgi:hypothetical protein
LAVRFGLLLNVPGAAFLWLSAAALTIASAVMLWLLEEMPARTPAFAPIPISVSPGDVPSR